jgi:hypothetical protein
MKNYFWGSSVEENLGNPELFGPMHTEQGDDSDLCFGGSRLASRPKR